MKVQSEFDTEVDRSGVTQDGEFGIIFNAKMAKILSDGLYSDKIGSIIRELCCNAIDSHVEAGCHDRPIEVHLPNQLEPWFHVRDFGVGLNNKQVNDIYTKYGASTKTNSNDFIGQLGLGSKSPFAYVDAFDITAIRDGRCGHYSMYRNEKGMPSVALLAEVDTTEPAGVTVKMPVRSSDMREFLLKAQQVFQWFDVQPQVTGASDFRVPERQVFWKGARWQLLDTENRYGSRRSSVAIMGRVAYPIATTSLGNVSRAVREFLSCQAVLHFGIGELEIAASREALGYDTRTQTAIVKAVEQAISELSASVVDKLAQATILWDAKKTWNTLLGQSGIYSGEMREILGSRGVAWRNQTISNGHVSFDTKTIWDGTCQLYRSSPRYSRLRHVYHQQCDIACRDNTLIIVNDLDRGGAGRANAHAKNRPTSEVWYFDLTNAGKSQAEVMDLLGNAPVVYTSSLPKLVAAPRTKAKMLKLAADGRTWDEVMVDEKQGGVYVLLDRNKIMRGNETFEDFAATLNQAINMGVWNAKTAIYAPRNDWKKKIPDNPAWKSFWSVLETSIVSKFTPAMLQNLSDADELEARNGLMRYRSWWEKDWSVLNSNSPWRMFCQRTFDLNKNNQTNQGANYKNILNLARELKLQIPGYPHYDVESQWTGIMKRYPMMHFIIAQGYSRVGPEEYKHARDYIQLVDGVHEQEQPQDYAWMN